MVLQLWRQIVLLWHLYQTIVQFDKIIVLLRKLATGSIHFLLLPPGGYSIKCTENSGNDLHVAGCKLIIKTWMSFLKGYRKIDNNDNAFARVEILKSSPTKNDYSHCGNSCEPYQHYLHILPRSPQWLTIIFYPANTHIREHFLNVNNHLS